MVILKRTNGLSQCEDVVSGGKRRVDENFSKLKSTLFNSRPHFQTPPRITSFLFAVLVVVVMPVLYQNSSAQGNTDPSELALYAEFSRQSTDIYLRYVDVISKSQEVDEVVVGILDGNVTKDYGEKVGLNKLVEIRLALSNIDGKLDALIVPDYQSQKYEGASKEMVSYLHGFKEQIYEFYRDSGSLLRKVLDGKKIDESEAQRRVITRSVLLLNGENRLMGSQLLSLEFGTPEYYNRKIFVVGNQFLMELMEAMLVRNQGEISDQKYREKLEVNNYKLEILHSFISKGQKSVVTTRRKLKGFKQTKNDVKLLGALFKAMSLYERSFDNEIAIAKLLNDITKSMTSGLSEGLAYSAFLRNSTKLQILVDLRMSLVTQRQQIIAAASR